jgi:hypothetical protein
MARNERLIPEAALRDKDSVEMLHVWIAEKKLHCSMKVGMYQEGMNMSEARAWGIILADVTRHLANAMQEAYSKNPEDTIAKIRAAFDKELGAPTSKAEGEFIERH